MTIQLPENHPHRLQDHIAYFDSLRNLKGVYDLRRAQAGATFPVFLPYKVPEKYLLNGPYFNSYELEGRLHISKCEVRFFGPAQLDYSEALIVQSSTNTSFASEIFDAGLITIILSTLCTVMPHTYHPPFEWGILKYAEPTSNPLLFDFQSQLNFASHISDKLKVYPTRDILLKYHHMEQPGLLSFAFAQDPRENSWVFAGAVGMSQSVFEENLASLVCLRNASEETLDQLQDRLNAT